MSLSISLIVRNSADVLERCLESVKDADEIVVVDTGSDDETIEIAKKYTDKVYEYWGCNQGGKKDGLFMNFADARNKSLSYCTSTHILYIDADEVLISGMDEMKAFQGESLSVLCINAFTEEKHYFPRFFINHPDVYFKGAAHNYLTCGNGSPSKIEIRYYRNKQHQVDPNRTLRILQKWVDENPKDCSREMYYLAKEYHKRGMLKKTIRLLRRYLKNSHFTIERADAFVEVARCYAGLGRHKDAINACMAAINLNPDFSEALRLAGDLNGDINRLKYQFLASKATDHGALFIRPNNRIKVTMLSEWDWCGVGYRIAQQVRKASGGRIDIETITKHPAQGSIYFNMMSGVPIHLIGEEVAQERINNSDIIHFKEDYPYKNDFFDLVIPYRPKGKEMKIVRLVCGDNFRNSSVPIKDYEADYNAYLTKDLHIDGWEYMPAPYTDFQYLWKRRKKFRIVHLPTGPKRKGTEMIADAIKLLNRDDVEFICHSKISRPQSLAYKSDASLYIDQMMLPHVGDSSYEAMGFGVPVISWTDGTDDIVLSPEKQTAESLAATIEAVLNWDILHGLSLAAFNDVQQRCSDMGQRWVNIYDMLIRGTSIPVEKLRARIMRNGLDDTVLTRIQDTPHFKYTQGDRQPFIDYTTKSGAIDPIERFEEKIKKYDHSQLIEVMEKDGEYIIYDGVHRASVLCHKGFKNINVKIIS